MKPLVSIIIPCYNAEEWIAEAIQSALDQTWSNVEIIVIDDGSTDGSVDVIKAFGEAVKWETGANRGGCAARNRGLELANGDWVQFLDADDLLLPDCVCQKMSTPHAENERVCCGVTDMEEAGSVVEYWKQKEYDLSYMIRIGSPQTAAPLHSREDLVKVSGFRIGLPCGQELDLHLRMAIQLGVIFTSHGETGVLTRHRDDSVSNSAYEMFPFVLREIALNALELIKSMEGEREAHVDAVAQRMGLLGRQLHRRGLQKEAMEFVHEAKRISPRWNEGLYKSSAAATLARVIGFDAFEYLHKVSWRVRGKARQ